MVPSAVSELLRIFLLQGQLSVLAVTDFGIRSTPVLPQSHVKDTGHSAGAGGKPYTYAPYVCGFVRSDTVNWCMVVWCTQNLTLHATSHVTK